MQSVIIGCGDIGRRVIKGLLSQGHNETDIIGLVNTVESTERCAKLGVIGLRFDLDTLNRNLSFCSESYVYYMVPPQKSGVSDTRSQAILDHFTQEEIKPKKVVLISTTGVYGDCDGQWVTEETVTKPQTDRGKRRLDSEQQWQQWGRENKVPVIILRVPGIYAYSRLPEQRIKKQIPVVRPEDCGFTNRIHADDLALMCIAAIRKGKQGEIFNATDGQPGKISDYLQEAAKALNLEPLPEISMEEGKSLLSKEMLSYLNESRKISNEKILKMLNIDLRHPNFREGIKH